MHGSDKVTGSLFSYVDLEEHNTARHLLRKIRSVVNDALRSLDAEFDRLYAGEERLDGLVKDRAHLHAGDLLQHRAPELST